MQPSLAKGMYVRTCSDGGAGFSRFLLLAAGGGESQSTGRPRALHREILAEESGEVKEDGERIGRF